MATVQLADLTYGPSFQAYQQRESTRLNAFVAAGVVVADAAVAALAQDQGFLHNMPKWGRVANDEPNASTDNPADVAVPKKIGTEVEIARKLMRNQGWSSSDLAAALVSQDPMEVIAAQLGAYWAGVNQTTIIKMCLGILADNVANDSGDMVKNVATDSASAITDAERFADTVMIAADQTLGDAKGTLTAIAVHSVIHARMQTIGVLVDNFDPETGRVLFQTFMGKRVIVDDDMPVTIGTNRTTYTSILFGAGLFRQGLGTPKTPTAVDREEAQGNGEGIEVLWQRRHEIIHPRGFAVAGTQVSAVASPSYATLALAASWNRIAPRKLIPLAFVQTNG
jgi:hypothetical protein